MAWFAEEDETRARFTLGVIYFVLLRSTAHEWIALFKGLKNNETAKSEKKMSNNNNNNN